MSGWLIWLSIGVLLLAFEAVTLGFVLLCFSIGAILTSSTLLVIDIPLAYQLIIFAIGSILSLAFIRPALKRLNKEEVPMNVYSLEGKTAVISKAFDLRTRVGRVKIDGDDWRAILVKANPRNLHLGDIVTVVHIDSNTLIVEPIKSV